MRRAPAGFTRVGQAGAVVGALFILACTGSPAATVEQAPAPAPPTRDASTPAAPQTAAHPPFDAGRAWKDLERQVAFGPRPSGSKAIEQTRADILAELKKSGIQTTVQAFTARTPVGEIAMANVIGTIPGRRTERIAFASHFDTKRFDGVRFVGANDGASSTAALLELARVLKQRANEYTIDLLFFDGEEAVVDWYRDNDNTYGSRHYVEAARQADTLRTLKALILLDMVADRDLVIKRDANSTPWLVDLIWAAAARLGHRAVFSNELTVIQDDHLPFVQAGIPAADVIDLEYPAWHTPGDTPDKLSPKSLQIVGDVILAALPEIERAVGGGR